MQQLSVHDYYDLGKKIDHIEREIGNPEKETDASPFIWPLFVTRWNLLTILQEPCALLSASQRAARSLMAAITEIVPEEVEDIFKIEKPYQVYPSLLSQIRTGITNFETILKNDMPEMSTFAVAQIGIYRTEDLINRAYLQISEELRPLLLPLALKDVTEAGKCLAFRVPTAAAFHMSRAIETGMNQYYEALAGHPFNLANASRNWAIKTDSLKGAGAEDKITEFLIHIRKTYRNPITHPDVILESGEAFSFFSQALSVISTMLAAVKTLEEKRQPALAGLYESQLSGIPLLDSGRIADADPPL